MITADYHIHSDFSPDGHSKMEEIVRRAVSLGLREIALTDHRDYIQTGVFTDFTADFDAYRQEFYRLKEKYEKDIILTFGIELGLSPFYSREIESFLANNPVDFAIGSSHDPPQGTAYYREGYFSGKSKLEAYTEYFEHTLENIRSTDSFNVYGHLDYIFRYSTAYGVYEDNSLSRGDYADIIDTLLRELISRGKGVEVNTSGYRYGLGTVHPQPEILKRYRELGGEIVTVGSDAHKADDIAKDFDRAEDFLKECGFTAYTLFRGQKPVWQKF